MMTSPGYWLSLRGLCAIVEYDYVLTPHCPYLDSRKPNHRILAEKLGLEFNDDLHVDVPEELIDELPLDVQMDLSPISIVHPEGVKKSLEWYVEVIKHAGKYYKQGYKEVEYYQNAFGGFNTSILHIPSREKIKELNPLHYEWHKNLDYREEVLIEEMRHRPDPWAASRATPEDIQSMLDEWDKEKEERHEEFKKKNIWGQL
jgi:hypothetical protein